MDEQQNLLVSGSKSPTHSEQEEQEDETSSSDLRIQEQETETPQPLLLNSTCLQIFFFVLLVQNLAFGGGCVIGIQSIFGPLESHNFCATACENEHHILSNSSSRIACSAQKKCLAHAVNLACSFLNLCTFAVGLVSGYLGGLWSFTIGSVIIFVTMNLFSADIQHATGLRVALPASCIGTQFLFFSAMTKLIPDHLPRSRINLSSSLLTSFWDAAIAITPLIGVLLQHTELSVAMAFFVFSLLSAPSSVVIICIVVWRLRQQDKSENEEIVDHENQDEKGVVENSKKKQEKVNYGSVQNESSSSSSSSSPNTKKFVAFNLFSLLSRILKMRRVYALTCGATSVVVYGYFIMANMGLLVSVNSDNPSFSSSSSSANASSSSSSSNNSHNRNNNNQTASNSSASVTAALEALEDETHNFEKLGSILMGVLGAPTGFCVGSILDHYKNKVNKVARCFAIFQAIALVVVVLLVGLLRERDQSEIRSYASFVIVVIWRMCGFTSINSLWCSTVAEKDEEAGEQQEGTD